jgi:hypothetical protein
LPRLALGIGINTGLFTVVEAVLIPSSSSAEIWAGKQLNGQEQKKLSGNGSAKINADVYRRTRSARYKTLMELIQNRDEQGAEHRCDRGPAPQGPVFDGQPVKRLSPTVEKCDTHEAVTDEVAGLADEMMQVVPMGCSDRSKEPHPKRIKPVAGILSRHGGRGLEGDHQNAQHRRNPIQDRP